MTYPWSQLKNLPEKSGVYMIFDKKDDPIFIAQTENIKKKVLWHISDKGSKRNIMIQKKLAGIDYEVIENKLDATKKELELIQQYNPPLNGRKKGMKQYRFVRLTMNEEFPRVRKSKLLVDDDSRYFGPFPKSRHIQRVISIAANYYQVADCGKEIVLGEKNKIVQTCIRRQTKQCMRPCEIEVNEDEYQKALNGFIKFFEGVDNRPIEFLNEEMKVAINNQDFEKAAKIRNDLESIEKVFSFKK